MMNIQQFADEQRRAEMARIDKMYESTAAALQATFDAQMQGLSRSYKGALDDINKHYGIDDDPKPMVDVQSKPAVDFGDDADIRHNAEAQPQHTEEARPERKQARYIPAAARTSGMVPQ